MKLSLVPAAVLLLLTACNNQANQPSETTEPAAAKEEVTLPYTPFYSSSFEMGNPKYSAMILQGSWKDWENNSLDNMKSWIADTITADHSDFTTIHGADSLMAAWKAFRAKFSSSTARINAVMSVHSVDKNEDWVLVWATAYDTWLDGRKDTSGIMETWRINKDGKADYLVQFDRAKRKQ